ncbi:hypothetical protein BaRGS_00035906 [Batillaria attramentaria]|uniref:Uncharacterized protein n=1 Tax=Batillaria attramentaria TaxID=370345 RepID=A0ABD0JCV8_9CAEN
MVEGVDSHPFRSSTLKSTGSVGQIRQTRHTHHKRSQLLFQEQNVWPTCFPETPASPVISPAAQRPSNFNNRLMLSCPPSHKANRRANQRQSVAARNIRKGRGTGQRCLSCFQLKCRVFFSREMPLKAERNRAG